MEEEYEQRISDLQSDLNQIRATLQEAEYHHRTTERERSGLIGQLTEQNQRLTSELKEAGKREEELQKRLLELRSQVNDKRVTMQDHVNHLETLKDEVKQSALDGSFCRTTVEGVNQFLVGFRYFLPKLD